ncbi:Uncharacterised protein [Serratia quinivorans]|jgi:hypothetical protein|uniref:Uncharacterized protein n=1 Tax=Serratia quinivorans TaxID=137545 RepID=A0A379ZWX7_9GAMM|nr:Uncharacterised protein [Serratia quinivorans]SUI69940.1 Uncharacterised protein [Serratia quinivorans]
MKYYKAVLNKIASHNYTPRDGLLLLIVISLLFFGTAFGIISLLW